jgi:SAM-dependent methyltransferase
VCDQPGLERKPTEARLRGRRAPSEYQAASHAYYDEMRESHTGVYSSCQRMAEEQNEKRYTNVEPPEAEPSVRNLGSFIHLLRGLCGPGPRVCGIDFGCGSHWVVDFVRHDPAYRWDAVGYDPDRQAIELAHQRFPRSAGSYRRRDLLSEGLPERPGSQDFIFCNAVLQHCDNEETDRVLAEMSRVLRRGGYCLLIFKRWTDDLSRDDGALASSLRVLDANGGKVLFCDPTMKRVIDEMAPAERDQLDEPTRQGWRLLHLFRVDEVVRMAAQHGLVVAPEIPVSSAGQIRGVITYTSGKAMPTACVVLRKPPAEATT